MTKPMMDLRELVEKSGDADLLREMIGFAAERLMELEVGGQTGAAYGEKSPERRAQRNGYRDRDWQTRAGCQSAANFDPLSASKTHPPLSVANEVEWRCGREPVPPQGREPVWEQGPLPRRDKPEQLLGTADTDPA